MGRCSDAAVKMGVVFRGPVRMWKYQNSRDMHPYIIRSIIRVIHILYLIRDSTPSDRINRIEPLKPVYKQKPHCILLHGMVYRNSWNSFNKDVMQLHNSMLNEGLWKWPGGGNSSFVSAIGLREKAAYSSWLLPFSPLPKSLIICIVCSDERNGVNIKG